jgi:hypothetical protein
VPATDRIYRLDTTYEDRRDGLNQFVAWLGIKNAGGIRPLLRRANRRRGDASDLAALVVISRNVSGSGYNPWQDAIERHQGRIFYWGDAKADPQRGRDDFEGNRYLAAIWLAVNERRWGDVPPILHFSKDEKGTARFNGLCVLNDLQDAWFEDHGRRVRNYRAVLDVLPVDAVDVAWLGSRAACLPEVNVPAEWKLYARSGDHERLFIWAKLVRRAIDQLPPHGSPEWGVLEKIHALDPLVAERLVVRAFKALPIAHTITATPPTKDGGFDFHGQFELPPPLGYSIALKGEVKRYNPGTNKVGPREVARLVARLQRGEHGVFVTTSAFTRQCQEEVFADEYPVELISGGKLVGMLQQLGAVRAGDFVRDWVAA